jgi:nucleoside-diphosphate-sugar epimerase
VKTEDDPLDEDPPARVRRTLEAIRYVEGSTLQGPFEGLALRYGGFYGPGSSLARTGPIADAVRRRRFPIVGSAAGVWSFVHLEDAAEATALAVERGAPGVYNVTDDEPAPVRDWLPVLADALGAPAPRPCVGRAPVRRGARRHDDDRAPRRVEREGEARAGMDVEVPELAPGLPRRARVSVSEEGDVATSG